MQLILVCHKDCALRQIRPTGSSWTSPDDVSGGPARTRTEDQGIHSTPPFPARVDYLFTPVGCGTLVPVIKRNCSAQVVSAPSGGAPPAWLRIASGRRSSLAGPVRFP